MIELRASTASLVVCRICPRGHCDHVGAAAREQQPSLQETQWVDWAIKKQIGFWVACACVLLCCEGGRHRQEEGECVR